MECAADGGFPGYALTERPLFLQLPGALRQET